MITKHQNIIQETDAEVDATPSSDIITNYGHHVLSGLIRITKSIASDQDEKLQNRKIIGGRIEISTFGTVVIFKY